MRSFDKSRLIANTSADGRRIQYKQRHGAFPPWAWNSLPERPATPTTLGWVKSRQIAYAKARQREAAE